LQLAGVIEKVPDVAPSPAHLTELARAIRQQQVKVICTEPHHSSKLAYRLGRDLGVPVASLDTLESGPLRPQAYEEGMRSNLRALQRHLK
jgi:ABC-type Zn uptake system ZnuABC Zn-binding protein ZnuA